METMIETPPQPLILIRCANALSRRPILSQKQVGIPIKQALITDFLWEKHSSQALERTII